MKKRIEIQCNDEIYRILITALTNYIDVAFPPHSADCAQVARTAMQDAVAELQAEFERHGHASYNKRLRAMFREGIKLHYQLQEAESGHSQAAECELLLEVVGGARPDPDALIKARCEDAQGHHTEAGGSATGSSK